MSKRRRVTYASLHKLAYELGIKGIIIGFRRAPRGVTVHMTVNNKRVVQYYRNFYDVYDLLLKLLTNLEKKETEK